MPNSASERAKTEKIASLFPNKHTSHPYLHRWCTFSVTTGATNKEDAIPIAKGYRGSWLLSPDEQHETKMECSYPEVLGDPQMDADESFSEKSLAAADSLALSPGNEIYLEHSLPSDVVAYEKKRKKRLTLVICTALVAIVSIVFSVLLTKSQKAGAPKREITTGAGDIAQSVEEPEVPLPVIYYVLESKVNNPEALLDISTPEGKAFHRLVEETSSVDISTATRTTSNDVDVERYALLVLYYGADGGAWTSTIGWSTPDAACNSFYGVTCRNSIVTGIDLGKNVAVRKNRISVSPRDSCWPITHQFLFCRLTQCFYILHIANTDRNNLHGKIPEDFCLMSDLRNLRLSGNELELPSCFSRLSNLEELDLRGNSIAGELPSDLYSLSSLSCLELAENDFAGSIDVLFPEISAFASEESSSFIFPNLKTLNLANNNLSGEVPENLLRRMPNLDTLSLDGNPDLTGSLNEVCKGDIINQINANCSSIECKCCTSGTDCDISL